MDIFLTPYLVHLTVSANNKTYYSHTEVKTVKENKNLTKPQWYVCRTSLIPKLLNTKYSK